MPVEESTGWLANLVAVDGSGDDGSGFVFPLLVVAVLLLGVALWFRKRLPGDRTD